MHLLLELAVEGLLLEHAQAGEPLNWQEQAEGHKDVGVINDQGPDQFAPRVSHAERDVGLVQVADVGHLGKARDGQLEPQQVVVDGLLAQLDARDLDRVLLHETAPHVEVVQLL